MALGTLVAALLAAPSSRARACEAEILELLSGRDVQAEFKEAMIGLGTTLKTATAAFNASREADAVQASRRALEQWMEIYVAYYTDPPRGFRDNDEWRLLLDSVSGPIRRIQGEAEAGRFVEGHDELRNLQALFGEFYDVGPRGYGGLDRVVQLGASLQGIRGTEGEDLRERRALQALLRRRYDRWKDRASEATLATRVARSFDETLGRLDAALAKGEDAPIRKETSTLIALLPDFRTHSMRAAVGLPAEDDAFERFMRGGSPAPVAEGSP